MQATSMSTALDIIRQLGVSIQKLAGRFIQWLPGANWLQILVICVPIAFMVTILPLVIMLFVLFLIAKWFLAGSDVPPLATSPTAPSQPSSTTGIQTDPEARAEQ